MKRNKTNHRVGKSGVSPYKKYAKKPFQYSPIYHAWKRDAMAGRAGELT